MLPSHPFLVNICGHYIFQKNHVVQVERLFHASLSGPVSAQNSQKVFSYSKFCVFFVSRFVCVLAFHIVFLSFEVSYLLHVTSHTDSEGVMSHRSAFVQQIASSFLCILSYFISSFFALIFFF